MTMNSVKTTLNLVNFYFIKYYFEKNNTNFMKNIIKVISAICFYL